LINICVSRRLAMELSGIELRYLVNEIKSKINPAYYVSSINAVTKPSFLFKMHHPKDPDIMLMVSTKGIWITRLKFESFEENKMINILKAELERAKIESIEQLGSERIITVKFRHLDEKVRYMVVEFFGDGNIVLCDGNMQIMGILKPIEVRHRMLKIGFRYAPPPPRGIDVYDITLEQLRAMREDKQSDSLDVVKWIGRKISIPKKYVEEIAIRAGISSLTVGQLSEEAMERLYVIIKEIISDIVSEKNHQPYVILGQNEKAIDAIPIKTAHLSKLNVKKTPSYMDAVDEVLSNDLMDLGRNIRTIEIDERITALQHDIAEQIKAKELVLSKANLIRNVAHKLMQLSYQGVQSITESSVNKLLAENSANIILEKGLKYLEILEELILIESNLPKLSSALFTRAKEMERGNIAIEQSKARLEAQIQELQNQTISVRKKIIIKQQTSKEWYERYRWFITTDGLLAIGGRDASSNSAIIRKHLTENDIVFHAEVHGSPFFIIKNTGNLEETGLSLQQVAVATVSFSRAWKDGISSADAYWVTPDQIKKGAPPGQYVPKGSFVIEGKRNYMKGLELRMAIGVARLENRYTVVCGPADAVKKSAIIYAILLPGGLQPLNVAKKIKSEFVRILGTSSNNEDLVDFVKTIMLEDFLRLMPSGQSKISLIANGENKVSSQNNSTSDMQIGPSVAALHD
jgi:predicted ribosome quality control (RQC) complex YloA/Tae2 family protein